MNASVHMWMYNIMLFANSFREDDEVVGMDILDEVGVNLQVSIYM